MNNHKQGHDSVQNSITFYKVKKKGALKVGCDSYFLQRVLC